MKKTIATAISVALTLSLAACSVGTTETPAPGGETTSAKNTIYVLGPTPDHGWTAQAGTYAEQKVADINAAGKYKAVYQPASDGEAQNDQVNTIISNGDAAGVVYFALDDSAKAGAEAMIAANVPFMFFDRIIDGPDKQAILNFSGDNWAVGAGIAYWLQKNGMKPGDVLVTLIGDNGTVSSRRQEGFDEFLQGTREYADQATKQSYQTTETWTKDQVSTLTATYKEVCDWSADKAYQYLEQKLPDIIKDAKAKGGNLYVYSMDDEMTFGFLNLVEGNTLDEATKKDLEDLKVNISAIGGMAELYAVIDGSSKQAPLAKQYFDNLMSVYFSPKMMQTAIDDMVKYLDKEGWNYQVGAGEYEPVWIVDASNVKDYEGFTGH